MVKLTRLNGREFIVSSEMIKFIEEVPDTIITLRDDEKVMVRENPDEVVALVIDYARVIRSLPDQLEA